MSSQQSEQMCDILQYLKKGPTRKYPKHLSWAKYWKFARVAVLSKFCIPSIICIFSSIEIQTLLHFFTKQQCQIKIMLTIYKAHKVWLKSIVVLDTSAQRITFVCKAFIAASEDPFVGIAQKVKDIQKKILIS
jgi:hypothetical protein